MFEYPRQHRAGAGLAMGASDRQYPFALQHIVAKPLWAGNVGQAAIQYFLDYRHAAGHDVADHVQIGLEGVKLFGIETGMQVNARRFQLREHGWINVFVATGNGMPRFPRKHGDAAHEGAANSEYVDVHLL